MSRYGYDCGNWSEVTPGDDDRSTPFGERGEDASGNGGTVGVDDEGLNVIEGDSAHDYDALFDQHAAVFDRQVPVGLDHLDNAADHGPTPRTLGRKLCQWDLQIRDAREFLAEGSHSS